MDLIITILPVVTKDLPISPRFTPYNFLSRCKFSTLTTRQAMVEFYLLTFPRFPLRKKEHKSYFGKNRTHDFRTSRCAAYLLDHSGDERNYYCINRNVRRDAFQGNSPPPHTHTHTFLLTTRLQCIKQRWKYLSQHTIEAPVHSTIKKGNDSTYNRTE